MAGQWNLQLTMYTWNKTLPPSEAATGAQPANSGKGLIKWESWGSSRGTKEGKESSLKAFLYPGNKAQAARAVSTETNGMTRFQKHNMCWWLFLLQRDRITGRWKTQEFWNQSAWNELQLLYLTSCVTLCKFPNLSVPQFSPLEDEDNR